MKERPQWLKDTEVAEITGIAVQTLRNWRQTGHGPRFDKPTPKVVRYRLSEVERFMESR
jgi:predicted DNA-binding transcriptional regulator AlpA